MAVDRLHGKSILYIEPHFNAFENTKKMVLMGEWNSRKIDVARAENYRVAIRKMEESAKGGTSGEGEVSPNAFDIIFSEYDLGGKTAQDLLEHARRHKLIPLKTIFIMIAGERYRARVMSVLEYSPDSYVIKPIAPGNLETRILRAIANREELYPIYEALDNKDYRQALTLCDAYLAWGGRLSSKVLKFRGFIYLQLREYEQAKIAYEQICEIEKGEVEERGGKLKSIPYAEEWLAKSLFYLGDYEKSEEILKNLIEINPDYMSGYDTYAEMLLGMGRDEDALTIYSEATKRSPQQFMRQKQLWELALDLGKTEIAEWALRSLISDGRSSNATTPDVFVHHAEVQLIKWIDPKRVLRELNILSTYYKDSEHAWSAAFCLAAGQLEAFRHTNNRGGYQDAMEAALDQHKKGALDHPHLSERLRHIFALRCAEFGKTGVSEMVFSGLVRHSRNMDRIRMRTANILKDPEALKRFEEVHVKVAEWFASDLKEISSQFLKNPEYSLRIVRDLLSDFPGNPEILSLSTQLHLRHLDRHLFRDLTQEKDEERVLIIEREIISMMRDIQRWYGILLQHHPRLAEKYHLKTLFSPIKKKFDDSGIAPIPAPISPVVRVNKQEVLSQKKPEVTDNLDDVLSGIQL